MLPRSSQFAELVNSQHPPPAITFFVRYRLQGGEFVTTTARRVTKLLRPSWSKERIVIVLRAYLDGSGTDPQQKVVAVAGWAASEREWDWWEREWLALLAELNIKRWHHTDFLRKKGEYADWNDAKNLLAHGEVCRIMNEIRPFGIGAAVWRVDYEELWKTGKWNMPRDPYAFCLDHCLEALIHRFHEVPRDEGIAIYVDQDDPEHIDLGRRVAAWHEAYLRSNREARNPDRAASTIYGSNLQYIPLQAADILANETYRYMHDKTGIPYLGAMVIGATDVAARPMLEAIKGRSYLQVTLYSKARLEWELEGTASGDHQIHGGYARFIPASDRN
jgi:hypothetical protein